MLLLLFSFFTSYFPHLLTMFKDFGIIKGRYAFTNISPFQDSIRSADPSAVFLYSRAPIHTAKRGTNKAFCCAHPVTSALVGRLKGASIHEAGGPGRTRTCSNSVMSGAFHPLNYGTIREYPTAPPSVFPRHCEERSDVAIRNTLKGGQLPTPSELKRRTSRQRLPGDVK